MANSNAPGAGSGGCAVLVLAAIAVTSVTWLVVHLGWLILALAVVGATIWLADSHYRRGVTKSDPDATTEQHFEETP